MLASEVRWLSGVLTLPQVEEVFFHLTDTFSLLHIINCYFAIAEVVH